MTEMQAVSRVQSGAESNLSTDGLRGVTGLERSVFVRRKL